MNINKSNPLGIKIIENKFQCLKKTKHFLVEQHKHNLSNNDSEKEYENHLIHVRLGVFDYKKNQKIFKLTKNIVSNCKLINLDSIKENIDINDFNFDSLVILLENDNSGLIKIDRCGSDFDFLYLKNLNLNKLEVYVDTYSFLTKEFFYNNEKELLGNEFVMQILAYLYYGEITTKTLNPKEKTKINSFSSYLNNSKVPITYVDSLWKQRICVNGFKVRGHFRLQPFGENRSKKKLIWIEEFSKDGYNRKATRELV